MLINEAGRSGAMCVMILTTLMLAACSGEQTKYYRLPSSEKVLEVNDALLQSLPAPQVASSTELRYQASRSVYFPANSATLSEKSSRVLAANVRFLNHYKISIRLLAYADEGAVVNAQELAAKRALVVKRELLNIGLSRKSIDSVGFKVLPSAFGKRSWHGNRRVDLIYLPAERKSKAAAGVE